MLLNVNKLFCTIKLYAVLKDLGGGDKANCPNLFSKHKAFLSANVYNIKNNKTHLNHMPRAVSADRLQILK